MTVSANANLFSRLFDNLAEPGRLAIETEDGTRITIVDRHTGFVRRDNS